jgi:hypothetical protein
MMWFWVAFIAASFIVHHLFVKEADMSDRTKEHYGLYGTACIMTGQFDAGLCWKCQIKLLKKELGERECYGEWCGKSPSKKDKGLCPACDWRDKNKP